MSSDAWIEFNGIELVNLSRTAQLAQSLGITSVWATPESTAWIEDALDGTGYDDITDAPWYDAAYPASAEFAGLVPLGFPGLGDSTLTANVTEYITDGGTTTKPRSATQTIVASGWLVAATARGAEYGKRWLDRVLRGSGASATCTGHRMRYFRWSSADSPIAHYRDVRTTRGASITRRVKRDCSFALAVTFTLTAADPFEYGEPVPSIEGLGGTVSGPGLVSDGTLTLTQEGCPAFDYSPVYDPTYPALVPAPTVPSFYPAGWTVEDGDTFDRYWAIVDPIEPVGLAVVPVITLTTDGDARMVRVSVWDSDATTAEQCGPLFGAMVSYLPGGVSEFTIDGEQQASYLWDGVAPVVRRTDSLVYSPDARPVDWTSFSTEGGLLVTLDVFDGADIEMALAFVPKSQ